MKSLRQPNTGINDCGGTTSAMQPGAMQEEKGLVDEEARERDALYERAERLTSALHTIGDSLRDIIEDVNAGMRLCHLSAACLAEFQVED